MQEGPKGNFKKNLLKAFELLNKPSRYYTEQEILEASQKLYAKYPKIKLLKENLESPNYLPHYDEIIKTFRAAGGEEDALKIFCQSNNIFEFWNEEFITAFSKYVDSKIKKVSEDSGKPITILEVGSGDGKLSFLLDKFIKVNKDIYNIIATDSGLWNQIKSNKRVEKIGNTQAIEKYNPELIISSWMPKNDEWTSDFRKNKSVAEYILIGDPKECGQSWKTWGWQHPIKPPEVMTTIPAEEDGFSGELIYELHKKQIGRTDKIGFKNLHLQNSIIVSFKRH